MAIFDNILIQRRFREGTTIVTPDDPRVHPISSATVPLLMMEVAL
jgi:hypothetical protein